MTKTFKMTFTEPVLGTASANPDIHRDHVAKKAPPEKSAEEIALLEEAIASGAEFEKQMTVFPRDEHGLFVFDFQLRGFYKESLAMLIELGDDSVKSLSKWTVKRAVDGILFVNPRRVRLKDVAGNGIAVAAESMTRPLRADTLQGPRICLATSEMLPVGTNLQFEVEVLEVKNAKSKLRITEEAVLAAMAYGSRRGFAQWRGGGWGRFSFEEI